MNYPISNQEETGLRRRSHAFTLVEVLMASAIVVVGLSSVFVVSYRNLQMMRSARESASVSQILQQRAEQFHIASYEAVTSTTGTLSLATLMAEATDSESELSNLGAFQEVVLVSDLAGTKGIKVSRNLKGVEVIGTGDLSTESTVRATFEVNWIPTTGSSGGKALQRQFTTVLCEDGMRAGNIVASGDRPTLAPVATPTVIPTVTPKEPIDLDVPLLESEEPLLESESLSTVSEEPLLESKEPVLSAPVYLDDDSEPDDDDYLITKPTPTPTPTPTPSPTPYPLPVVNTSPTPTPVISSQSSNAPTPTPAPSKFCRHFRYWQHCSKH